jgi:hypothetical protein
MYAGMHVWQRPRYFRGTAKHTLSAPLLSCNAESSLAALTPSALLSQRSLQNCAAVVLETPDTVLSWPFAAVRRRNI